MQSNKLPMLLQTKGTLTAASPFKLILNLTPNRFAVELLLLLIILKFPGANNEEDYDYPYRGSNHRRESAEPPPPPPNPKDIKDTAKCNKFCEKRNDPGARHYKASTDPAIGYIIKCYYDDEECNGKCYNECTKICTTDNDHFISYQKQINCPPRNYGPTNSNDDEEEKRRNGCTDKECIIFLICMGVGNLVFIAILWLCHCMVFKRRRNQTNQTTMAPPQPVIQPGGRGVTDMNNQGVYYGGTQQQQQQVYAVAPQQQPYNPGYY